MFDVLFDKLADAILARVDAKRSARAWTKTQECWQCGASIPVAHRVCGMCGAPVQSTPSLLPAQEQIAAMDTIQVQIVPQHIRVSREKHPLLYGYLAAKHDTGKTEPIHLSSLQTRRLMRKLEI